MISHLSFLRCPDCRSRLALADGARVEDGTVTLGTLVCGNESETCGRTFPVQDGIPMLLPHEFLKSQLGGRHGTA